MSQMHDVNPDAISYLDVGTAFWRGDPTWINGLWSPLYGVVTVGCFDLLHLSRAWEYAVCHFVSLVFYVLALFGYRCFILELLTSLKVEGRFPGIVTSLFMLIAFGVFLEWNHALLVWISPDAALGACLIWAAALFIRTSNRGISHFRFLLIGAVLGIGFLVKAPGLPLGATLLVAGFFYLGPSRRKAAGLLAALMPFALMVTAYAIPLSLRYGRLTFGDSAQLNYAWHVQQVRYIQWQGDSIHGQPLHPTRKLMDNPEVFSFGDPLIATYAAYYDPAYWFAGLRTPFSLHEQAAAILVGLNDYGKILFTWQNAALLLTIGFFIAWDAELSWLAYGRTLRAHAPLLLWCVIGMAMFGLVHVEQRYVTALGVIAWAILLAAALSIQTNPSVPRRMLPVAAAIVVISTLVGLVPELGRGFGALRNFGHPDSNSSWVIAQDARRFGLQPGGRIAALGTSFHHAFWARLGGYRIVAEVPQANEYWSDSAETKRLVNRALCAAGARFLIALDAPPAARQAGWSRIGKSNYSILPLGY
jgi:hypothetical protein